MFNPQNEKLDCVQNQNLYFDLLMSGQPVSAVISKSRGKTDLRSSYRISQIYIPIVYAAQPFEGILS